MEILTVKNNKMDYSTYKKIIILFYPTKSKILFVAAFCLGLIFLLIGLNKDVVYFDLIFGENELYSKGDLSTNKVPIKYKDLKKINETNDIVFFTSNAGFKTYFEKKNASIEDIERLHTFFDKQNIKWKKSIL